jgi:dihydroxy-acid dehydratase
MAQVPLYRSRSAAITEGPHRAGARAMLKAVGFDDEALKKPIVGVANTWIEIGPCNYHLRELAASVKEGIREAGGTPMEFNTVSISDGITMGSPGMRASLISREVIADSIELVSRGNCFDAVIALCGCDKTIPGTTMAVARLGVPGLVLYGGSIAPGRFENHDVTIQDVYEGIGAHAAGKMTDAQLKDLEDHACPGAGACGGQFTANTMATAIEFLGIAPMGSGSVPAVDPAKADVGRQAGRLVMDLVRRNLTPAQILTRQSIENAIAAVVATGGSTNAVLHLLAIARESGIPLTIDDFDRISRQVPLLADLKPGGRFVATDLHRAGGIRLVAQRLLDAGLLHADQMTVTGQDHRRGGTVGQRNRRPGGRRARSTRPISPRAALRSRKGNLAPEGAVVKVSGLEPETPPRPGPACSRRAARARRGPRQLRSSPGRGGHPAGRPQGRPRHARDARRSPPRSSVRDWCESVVMLTDGRFSGATRGLMAGHVAPRRSRADRFAATARGRHDRVRHPDARLDVELPDERLQSG